MSPKVRTSRARANAHLSAARSRSRAPRTPDVAPAAPPSDEGGDTRLAPLFDIDARAVDATLAGVVDDYESIDEHADVIEEPVIGRRPG